MAEHATQTAARQYTYNASTSSETAAVAARRDLRPEDAWHHLQQVLGNQALQRSLLSAGQSGIPGVQRKCSCQHDADEEVIQTKLMMNQPGDAFEQEAERVADAVMSASAETVAAATDSATPGSVLRTCACGGTCEDCQRKVNVVQRATPGAAGGVATAPPIVDEALRSPGQPLDSTTRTFMESRFAADLGHVRIHNDTLAAESARAIDARAYTVGHQIAFAKGEYSPHTHHGRRLLAHELSHVMQQNGSGPVSALQRTCGETDIATKVGTRAACTDIFDGKFLSGLPLFKFQIECDDFAAGQDTALTSFVAGLPATTTLEIHGFASADGSKSFNENLGCARAFAALSLLTTATPPGFTGILSSRVTAVVNHGPVKAGKVPVADLRSVVIRTTPAIGPKPAPPTPPAPATVQTVAFPADIRGTATPAAMTQDRIPPRVDTPVKITFGGTPDISAPVTLSIDGAGGGNGSATIEGAASFAFAVSGAQVVKLRGVDQTDVGKAGNLKLIARQRGTLLAESKGFSVSSIPQNMSFTFNRLFTAADCTTLGLPGCRGIVVDYAWESDSTVQGDLDKASQSERIQTLIAIGFGSVRTGCYFSSILPQSDFHGGGGLAGSSGSKFVMLSQDFMFKDARTGASEIPMTNSGFLITHSVAPKPGSGFLGFFQGYQLTSSKGGMPGKVTDPNTTCPSGPITSNAGKGSTTKTEDL